MGNFLRDLRRTFFKFINYNKDKAATHKAEEVGRDAGTSGSVTRETSAPIRKRENVTPVKRSTQDKRRKYKRQPAEASSKANRSHVKKTKRKNKPSE